MSKYNILGTGNRELQRATWESLIEGAQHRIAVEVEEGIPCSVYRLDDPRNQAKRYVGCGKDPHQRFRSHLACRDTNQKKHAWIHELQQQGLQPMLVILEVVLSPTYARIREAHWIASYRQQQATLLNARLYDELFGAAITILRDVPLDLPPNIVVSSLSES
jgi:hypothetical protein